MAYCRKLNVFFGWGSFLSAAFSWVWFSTRSSVWTASDLLWKDAGMIIWLNFSKDGKRPLVIYHLILKWCFLIQLYYQYNIRFWLTSELKVKQGQSLWWQSVVKSSAFKQEFNWLWWAYLISVARWKGVSVKLGHSLLSIPNR